MTNDDFLKVVLETLHRTIEARVASEVRPIVNTAVDRILREEVAAVAVRVSHYVEMRTMSDRLIIEIRTPTPTEEK